MSSPWDDADNVATLKRLHAEGKSSREIAHALGCWARIESGRNAVISKIHRLGLSNGKRSKVHRERKRQQHAPERRRAVQPPKAPEKLKPRREAVRKLAKAERKRLAGLGGSEPVLFQHLPDNGCAHRVNSHLEREVWVCGARTARPASAYCPEHEPTRSRP